MGKNLVNLLPGVGLAGAVKRYKDDSGSGPEEEGIGAGFRDSGDSAYLIGQGFLNLVYLAVAGYTLYNFLK